MSITKTPILDKYLEKIVSISDQFHYYKFIVEEFENQLSNFGEKVNELMVTDVFVKNQYAANINVKVGDLPNFRGENSNIAYGMFFSTLYELFNNYIEDVLSFLQDVDEDFEIVHMGRVELTLRQSLQANGYKNVDQELIDTFAYMRHRRNHFIHLYRDINKPLKDILKNKAEHMDEYWKRNRSTLSFKDTSVFDYNMEDTLDLIKILRVMFLKVDERISMSIEVEEVKDYIIENEFDNYNKSKKNKLYDIMKEDFGLEKE